MNARDKYLTHQYLYVPWVSAADTITLGKTLGLHLGKQHKAGVTVVCPLKSNVRSHPELAKLPVVSERSGYVRDGGVVLAWCPTKKVMDKLNHLEKSIVIVVEWPTENFEAWAKLVGAYNVLTDEVMVTGLDENGMKSLEGVVWEGYNGWQDRTSEILTTTHLKELTANGQYDRDVVLAYAQQRRGSVGIQRLTKILNDFERTLTPVK